MKYVAGFGRFWYDFIVGDSVILAFGGVAVPVLGLAVTGMGSDVLAQVLLPVAVVSALVASLPRLRRS